MADLDNVMDVLNSLEEKENRARTSSSIRTAEIGSVVSRNKNKTQIGSVECFFSKIGVVAIKLEDTLRVGDVIEIGSEDEAVRQRIASMQIDRQDVSEAYAGDSVGIKLKYKVPEGSAVYKVE